MTYTPLPKHIPHHQKSPQSSRSSKEAEPMGRQVEPLVMHETVEHEVQDSHVKDHVEVKKEVPTIPPDLQKIGVSTSASSQFPATKSIKLPMDSRKLPQALHAPLSDSVRWLAALTEYMMEHSLLNRRRPSASANVVQDFIRMLKRDIGK